MAKTPTNDFWDNDDGRLIKNYGTWLMFYGIICTISLMLNLFVCITNNFYFGVLWDLVLLSANIFFIIRGFLIRSKKLAPQQILNTSTFSLAFIIIACVILLLINISAGSLSAYGSIIGFLDIITIIDSVRYRRNWHAPYVEYYNTKHHIVEKITEEKPAEEKVPKNKQAAKSAPLVESDAYEDDLL